MPEDGGASRRLRCLSGPEFLREADETKQPTTGTCCVRDHRNQDGRITPLPVVWVSNTR
jgi:hypothetical protein